MFVLALASASTASAQNTITVGTPTPNQNIPFGSSVIVSGTVQGVYILDVVIANSGQPGKGIQPGPSGQFTVTLDGPPAKGAWTINLRARTPITNRSPSPRSRSRSTRPFPE